MPAPSASEIKNLAGGALRAEGLRGENAPDLAAALSEACAQAFSLFVSMALVAPGIPAAAPPPPGSGSTTGPGLLLPPPAGGPSLAMIQPILLAQLTSHGLRGQTQRGLAQALAQSIVQALTLFTTAVKVAPGIAIAGFTTSAPGLLIGAAPTEAQLEPLVLGFLQGQGLRGQNAPDLATAVARTLSQALTQMMPRLQVLPGIPCSPAATAGPGRLQ